MAALTLPFLLCAFISFALAEVLVLTSAQHGRFTMDLPTGVQKVHFTPTPRIGGIGIYASLLVVRSLTPPDVTGMLDIVLAAGIPAFAAGLAEDVTRRAGVAARMAATIGSGLLATLISGISLTHLSVPLLDSLLVAGPVAALVTAVAVGGIANAINIIDGFHGLAAGATSIALLAIALVASAVGDTQLAVTALVLIAALSGFWLVNFPWGKLFLGDGGAYFAGFALGWLAVLLPMRNPSVSPWASLLICGYPVIEVLYSIARRWRSRQSPGQPDGRHLHSIVARRVVHKRMQHFPANFQNAAVSVVMWVCAAIPALLGVTFYRHTSWLALSAATCVLLYHLLYVRLARP